MNLAFTLATLITESPQMTSSRAIVPWSQLLSWAEIAGTIGRLQIQTKLPSAELYATEKYALTFSFGLNIYFN